MANSTYSGPYTGPTRVVPLDERRAIIERVLGGPVDWQARDGGEWGYCQCPGVSNHSNTNGRRDCRAWAVENGSKPPGIHCLHMSCLAAVEEMNHRIRSAIGKAKVEGVQRSGQGRPAAAGNSAARHSRTDRMPASNVTSGGDDHCRTDRTGNSKTLSRYARADVRARMHAHAVQNPPPLPSDASGVAQPTAQPVPPATAQPRASKPIESLIMPAAERGSDDTPAGCEVTQVIGGVVQKGVYRAGEWIPKSQPRTL